MLSWYYEQVFTMNMFVCFHQAYRKFRCREYVMIPCPSTGPYCRCSTVYGCINLMTDVLLSCTNRNHMAQKRIKWILILIVPIWPAVRVIFSHTNLQSQASMKFHFFLESMYNACMMHLGTVSLKRLQPRKGQLHFFFFLCFQIAFVSAFICAITICGAFKSQNNCYTTQSHAL